MPLKLNVGLSRKVGEANYGSRGASINVEVEVDSSLVTEPTKLRERVRQLFDLARTSVDEELNGGHERQPQNGNGQGGAQANGQESDHDTESRPRPATQSQVKAIYGIAKNRNLNVGRLVRDRFQVAKPEQLSLKQASELIGELKNTAA